jgi:hypothetical protein
VVGGVTAKIGTGTLGAEAVWSTLRSMLTFITCSSRWSMVLWMVESSVRALSFSYPMLQNIVARWSNRAALSCSYCWLNYSILLGETHVGELRLDMAYGADDGVT